MKLTEQNLESLVKTHASEISALNALVKLMVENVESFEKFKSTEFKDLVDLIENQTGSSGGSNTDYTELLNVISNTLTSVETELVEITANSELLVNKVLLILEKLTKSSYIDTSNENVIYEGYKENETFRIYKTDLTNDVIVRTSALGDWNDRFILTYEI
jgi:hypothetical protein